MDSPRPQDSRASNTRRSTRRLPERRPGYREPCPPSKTVRKEALQKFADKILEGSTKMENPGKIFRGFLMAAVSRSPGHT